MNKIGYASAICGVGAVADYALLRYFPGSHRFGWELFGLQILLAAVGLIVSVIGVTKSGAWQYGVPLIACAVILCIQLL
jgi:hypothetical protein